jgi:signal transduction histidine kinase
MRPEIATLPRIKPLSIVDTLVGRIFGSAQMNRAEDDPSRRAKRLKIGIVAVVAVLILAMWSVVAISIIFARRGAMERTRSDGANLSAAFTDEVTHTLGSVAGAMDLVADRMRIEGAAFDIQTWSREIPLLAAPTIQGGIIGPDGKLVSTTLDPHSEPIDLSDREHFRVHLDGSFKGLFISKPIIGRVSKQATIQVSKRVEAADGRFLGVLVFSLAPGYLTTLHESMDLGDRGVIALVGLDGVIRARFSRNSMDDAAGLGASVAGTPRPAITGENDHGSYVRESVVDHVTRLYSYRRVPQYPLVVTVGLDLDEALAAASAQALLVVLLTAASTLLFGGLATYLVREIGQRAKREIDLANERTKLRSVNVALAHERSKLQTINSQLMVTKERAEVASRAKSLLLTNMSHEFRTPLNAIIGLSYLIKDQTIGPVGPPVYADYATDICGAGEHLLGLVNNLLDSAKLEAGKLELSEKAIRLSQVLEASLALVRTQAQKKNLSLEIAASGDLPPIWADEVKLRQILINLLSNAVKFTPEGGRVAVSTERADGGLAIVIADTGIGMSDEEVLVALEPFCQVDNSLTRKYEGSGLGLPLAKSLVELHGGSLYIESTKGKGTAVRVRLPAERVIGSRTADRTVAVE